MHKVDIPQEIIDACIRFRGRRYAFEHIEPRRTALVVIDMQNSWVQPGFSPLYIPKTRAIIPNINALAAAVRGAGGMVAWTRSTFPEDWTSRSYERFGSPEWRDRIVTDTVPGSHGHAIAGDMDVHAADVIADKTRPSAFVQGSAGDMDVHAADVIADKTRPSAFVQGSSRLEAELRARGRDTLIITGTLTNACCESSARDAAALGFLNIMVSDAMATRTDVEHNATLVNVMQLVADVRTTEDVIALLRDAGA